MLAGMRMVIGWVLAAGLVAAEDWPGWRGPERDNHAAEGANPVREWSAEKNVRWKAKIPGRGHSTPIVVGSRIYLTTATRNEQRLLALERETGELVWSEGIHRGGLREKLHAENSHASPTPQWDGEQVLVTFENEGEVKVSAVGPDGGIRWTRAVGPYVPHYQFGYGSTPVLHEASLIVSVGMKEGGYLVAIDTADGGEKWRIERGGHDYWTTPVVAEVAGREQLLMTGVGKMSSYDPDGGELLWEAPFLPLSTCGTVVWTNDMVFASGGFPGSQTAGFKADGSGEVVWKNGQKAYEQSLLAVGEHVFGVSDQGIAFCWRAADGEELWRQRIGRGGVMASPLRVGDHVYATVKNGLTTIFEASGEGFRKVAENQLGDDTYASPVVVGDELYLRVGMVDEGKRQEWLYCLAE